MIEEIENCNQEILNEKEIYWINFYEAYTKGYNLTKGGQNCGHAQKLSLEDEEQLVGLYKEGYSSLKLAEMFNVDKTTVLNYAKRHNIKRQDVLEAKVDIKAVKTYIRGNKPTARNVVEKFGICVSSVHNIIKRANDNTLILESYNPRKSKATIYSKEVCKKYKEGYNIQDLIKMFHTSKRYISKVLKENNVKIQRGRKALLS